MTRAEEARDWDPANVRALRKIYFSLYAHAVRACRIADTGAPEARVDAIAAHQAADEAYDTWSAEYKRHKLGLNS